MLRYTLNCNTNLLMKGGVKMFSLSVRKIILVGLIAVVFTVANAWIVVSWLNDRGVIQWADGFCEKFLTGTAITVIAAMLILYVSPRASAKSFISRCSVCDSTVVGKKSYCGDCGSKL